MGLSERTIKDIRTVTNFITGWWPGLEDAISWGSNDNDQHPVYQASRRLRAWIEGKPIPEPTEHLGQRRMTTRRIVSQYAMFDGSKRKGFGRRRDDL